ncbi:hypothetical protein [Dactylosporangium sp. CA-233914]|uniref:hypothetical protein n=1 Tax=Dactylosporangium sp. CA-233914 TaxID=3239934 RepID=UPI003D8FE64F
MPDQLWITLNARLRPLDRGALYEDPLQTVLDVQVPGSCVTGGGTLMTADREPTCCDIDLDVEGDGPAVLELVTATLEKAGAPKGSTARLDEREPVTFGVTEGLAVYLNGTDLPDEVYATSDINDLVAALLDSLGAEGSMQSYWQGPRETALYLYGPSATRMGDLIAEVLARFPLAQRCRLVPLPLTLPS